MPRIFLGIRPDRICDAFLSQNFDLLLSPQVDLSDPEFIMAVAALTVVDVRAIDDSVLSSAFSIFDMVGTVLVHTIVYIRTIMPDLSS